jgi:hypothetical protein
MYLSSIADVITQNTSSLAHDRSGILRQLKVATALTPSRVQVPEKFQKKVEYSPDKNALVTTSLATTLKKSTAFDEAASTIGSSRLVAANPMQLDAFDFARVVGGICYGWCDLVRVGAFSVA